MQTHQELVYSPGYDYASGSPHLKHRRLHASLLARLREAWRDTAARGLPPTLLDVGAGDGGFVEPSLAFGLRVTATEMSRPSIDHLRERYGANPSFAVVLDQDGSMSALGDSRFSIVLCASVLHHVPDYLAAIDTAISRHLEQGGAFVSLQDPLWYPCLGRGTRLVSGIAYLSWRFTRGNYVRGFRTRWRRLRRRYDDDPSDTVEYHVVRNGVDHQQIVEMLSQRFERVSLVSYWSTQSGFWQWIGERIGLRTTFAVIALGYRG